jgi:hypothetical protein
MRMSQQRFMTTIMCDDVRREEGNKLSYMGIYSSDLLVSGFPVTLPKLCFVMSVICPAREAPPTKLTFRLLRDEEVLAEMSISEDALSNLQQQTSGADSPDNKRLTIGTVIQMFPLQFSGPCVLKARALCDGEELKGGSWTVDAIATT